MATFNFRATKVSYNLDPRVLRAGFGDGYEQRVADGINTNLAIYDLTFDNLPQPQGDAVENFFLNNSVAINAFLWTPPNKTQGNFVCDGWQRDWSSQRPGVSTITCKFRQVGAP